jgi:hypothetical protein
VPHPEGGLRQQQLPARAGRDVGDLGAGTLLVEERPNHFVRRHAP